MVVDVDVEEVVVAARGLSDIRKSVRHWYDQIVLIAPNLVDATFYL